MASLTGGLKKVFDPGNVVLGTADSAISDAMKRQHGIDTEYQQQVQSALTPYQQLANGVDTSQYFRDYLSGLTGSNNQQYAVDASQYQQTAPDVSAATVQGYLDPSINYQMDTAQSGVEASAAGKGGLFSGAAGQDISNARQAIAQQGWSDAFGRARQAGLDANSATGSNFAGLMAANQFNQGLAQQDLTNRGTAFETAMQPTSAISQANLDMANTMYSGKTGLSQQQMQGQLADTGLLANVAGGFANMFSSRMGAGNNKGKTSTNNAAEG